MEQGKTGENIVKEPIRVDMDEWVRVDAPATVETTGLGPCVGVIMYDSGIKTAMVGHFVDPRTFANPKEEERSYSFNEMLDESRGVFKDGSHLRVWLGGQSPVMDDRFSGFPEDRAVRAFVLESFEKLGVKRDQIKVCWQDSNQSTIMAIDTSAGLVEYRTEDYDDQD